MHAIKCSLGGPGACSPIKYLNLIPFEITSGTFLDSFVHGS